MPSRTTVIAIGAVIAIPLIFAALGASRSAGLVLGGLLVAVGVGWSLLGGARGAADDDEARE